MSLRSDGPAPYAPTSAVIEVMRRYRDRGLSVPFNGDVLARAGVSESLIPRTLQALKLLELIDDEGTPTETLDTLAKAPEAEYRDCLASLIRSIYANVFAFVDPAQEPDRVRDAFRSFTPRGQQERMVTLFFGLAAHAGIVPEGAGRGVTNRAVAQAPRRERVVQQRRSAQTRGAQLPEGLPPVLSGLIAELVAVGPTWNAEQRDRFLSAFRSMVDYTFPVREPVSEVSDSDLSGEE